MIVHGPLVGREVLEQFWAVKPRSPQHNVESVLEAQRRSPVRHPNRVCKHSASPIASSPGSLDPESDKALPKERAAEDTGGKLASRAARS